MATLSEVAQLQYMEDTFAESGGKIHHLTLNGRLGQDLAFETVGDMILNRSTNKSHYQSYLAVEQCNG